MPVQASTCIALAIGVCIGYFVACEVPLFGLLESSQQPKAIVLSEKRKEHREASMAKLEAILAKVATIESKAGVVSEKRKQHREASLAKLDAILTKVATIESKVADPSLSLPSPSLPPPPTPPPAPTIPPSKPPPCECQTHDPSWKTPSRTTNKCVFIDLGAAHGNSFEAFLQNGYGALEECPGGDWEAVLVEANPRFKDPLEKVAANYTGKVTAMGSTAAWMCEAETSFYLMTRLDHNSWGSSLSPAHPDVAADGYQKVTVPTMNVLRALYERTIPGDVVWLKIDIEGTEYDIMPCLASPSESTLSSRNATIFVETHNIAWSMTHQTYELYEAATNALKAKGVKMPVYNSATRRLHAPAHF